MGGELGKGLRLGVWRLGAETQAGDGGRGRGKGWCCGDWDAAVGGAAAAFAVRTGPRLYLAPASGRHVYKPERACSLLLVLSPVVPRTL
eukprot:scaffold21696_cov84-Isochrysis_galbana.AAC.2